VEDSQKGGGLEESDNNYSSFIVSDDNKSVLEEVTASKYTLERGALEEVRISLAERIEKLKGKLTEVEIELEAVAESRDEGAD